MNDKLDSNAEKCDDLLISNQKTQAKLKKTNE